MSPKPTSSPPKPARVRKTPMPPPHELAQAALDRAKPKPRKRTTPLTTLDKFALAKTKKLVAAKTQKAAAEKAKAGRAVVHDGVRMRDVSGSPAEAVGGKGTEKGGSKGKGKEKMPSLMDFMRGETQGRGGREGVVVGRPVVERKKREGGVLVRPTERTKRVRVEMERAEAEEAEAKTAEEMADGLGESSGVAKTGGDGAGERADVVVKLEPGVGVLITQVPGLDVPKIKQEPDATPPPTPRLTLLDVPKIKQEPDTTPPPTPNPSSRTTSTPTPPPTLQTLPPELLTQILRLAIHSPTHFIYPAYPTGAEQPDLAMTCRALRSETLPLFYAENTFALDVFSGVRLEGDSMTMGRLRATQSGVAKTGGWMKVLGEKGHIQGIRKWVFSWSPPMSWKLGSRSSAAAKYAADTSLIVKLHFPLPAAAKEGAMPVVEVHRSAFCLLEGHADFGKCRKGVNKEWLETVVRDAVAKTKDRGGQIAMIGGVLEERAYELVGSRCVRADEAAEA